MPRELILLSPYTPPAHHALTLGADDTACWLNAWTALWHPAALAGAVGPPRWASPYDFDTPVEGHLYAVPDSPPLYLADDWEDRVRAAGAAVVHAAADRETTLASLREALEQLGADVTAFDWPADAVRPYFGLGLGYLVVDTLFEAMEHERLLDKEGFWADVQAALKPSPPSPLPQSRVRGELLSPPSPGFAGEGTGVRADFVGEGNSLRAAAGKLLSAREVLYPVSIHLLDFALLDERQPGAPLPAAFARRSPLNLIAPAAYLEALRQEHPERLAELRERFAAGQGTYDTTLELCGGLLVEREDELLPVESQLWNLRRGLAVSRELLGAEVQVYASRRGAFHPQSPMLLQQVGLTRALLVSFGDARLPDYKAAVVQWPSPDGRQVEAFTRPPRPADDPETYFHLGHYLHETIQRDQSATFALLHRPGAPAAPWYDDWLALTDLAPVLGLWTTAARYLGDGIVGEYATPASADEFAIDALEPRCLNSSPLAPGGRGGKKGRPLSPKGRGGQEMGRSAASPGTCACAAGSTPPAPTPPSRAPSAVRSTRAWMNN